MAAVKAGRAAPLRAVAPTERVADKSVAEAAKNGTQRELLVAMRDRIAETVSKADCPPRELGVLTKRLQDIVRDITALDAIGQEQRHHDGDIDDTFDASAI